MSEEDTLAWHALNYRTAHTNNAEEMWQKLQKFVARKRDEERELDIEEADRRAEWALRMCQKMVDDEQDRCCRIIFGLCLSDNNAQEIVNKIRSQERYPVGKEPWDTEDKGPAHIEAGEPRPANVVRQPRPEPYADEDDYDYYPLPKSLYPDSKDWVASDYPRRVEWLHVMYESKRQEVEQLETALLRAVLAQPEPVAWLSIDSIGERYLCFSKPNDNDEVYPLYTAPPQRKPLTEQEIYEVLGYGAVAQHPSVPQYAIEFVRAIEKAHGIGVKE